MIDAPSPSVRRRAAAALFVGRAVYALNWYNIGAILPLVGAGLPASTSQLGLILGAYLVGVAAFQVPAGLAAGRWGARRVALGGLVAMGAFAALCALSPSWPWLALGRLATGAGAAFFFAPGLTLIAEYYPVEERAPIVGLYNGGFNAGAGIGIFSGALLGASIGWSATLAVGGLLLLGVAALAAAVLPRGQGRSRPPSGYSVARALGHVFRSRSLWAASLALAGLWAAIYIVAQNFVQYAGVAHAAWPTGAAALLAAVVVVAAAPGGIAGGWLAKIEPRHRALLAAFTGSAGVVVLSIAYLPLWAIGPLFAYLGFADGVAIATLYFVPSYMPETAGEHLALALGALNAIQVAIGGLLAIAFGYVAEIVGYPYAWAMTGAVTIALLPLLWLVDLGRGTSPGRAPSTEPRPPPSIGPTEGL